MIEYLGRDFLSYYKAHQNDGVRLYYTNQDLPIICYNDELEKPIDAPKTGDLLVQGSGRALYRYQPLGAEERTDGLYCAVYQVYENGAPVADNGNPLGALIPAGAAANDISADNRHFEEGWGRLFKSGKLFKVGEFLAPSPNIVDGLPAGVNAPDAGRVLSLREIAETLKLKTDGGDPNGLVLVFAGEWACGSLADSGMETAGAPYLGIEADYVDNGVRAEVQCGGRWRTAYEYWGANAWMDKGSVNTAGRGERFYMGKRPDGSVQPTVPVRIYYFEQGGGQCLRLNVVQQSGSEPPKLLRNWMGVEGGTFYHSRRFAWVYQGDSKVIAGRAGTRFFSADSATELGDSMFVQGAEVGDYRFYLASTFIGSKVYECTESAATSQKWKKIFG